MGDMLDLGRLLVRASFSYHMIKNISTLEQVNEHYHVEIRQDPTRGWNSKGNVIRMTPDGYTKGSGTGFLPGESFPGGNECQYRNFALNTVLLEV